MASGTSKDKDDKTLSTKRERIALYPDSDEDGNLTFNVKRKMASGTSKDKVFFDIVKGLTNGTFVGIKDGGYVW